MRDRRNPPAPRRLSAVKKPESTTPQQSQAALKKAHRKALQANRKRVKRDLGVAVGISVFSLVGAVVLPMYIEDYLWQVLLLPPLIQLPTMVYCIRNLRALNAMLKLT